MTYEMIQVPVNGETIQLRSDFTLDVPAKPIIPCIQGDGIGIDVVPVALRVVDAAVQHAYAGDREISWMQVFMGQDALERYGKHCPEETLHALRHFRVSLKGPLATPIGQGIRSLNVEIRRQLDLYACVRPIRYFAGVTSPVREPSAVDMIVFRENTEDLYAGIEYAAGSPEAQRLIQFLQTSLGAQGIPFPLSCGIGIKPVSTDGTKRLVRKALHHALAHRRRKVTLVHKGNIMKHTEGAFRAWGYEVAREEFGAKDAGDGQSLLVPRDEGDPLIVNDVIADNFLQQILLRPQDFDVIATLNLNGDYISDALAAQVGGLGIAPGANIGDGIAVFEATHGTAPTIAGKNIANPSSVILSAEMMLRFLGWTEAADLLMRAIAQTIMQGEVTADLTTEHTQARAALSSSQFGEAIVRMIRAA